MTLIFGFMRGIITTLSNVGRAGPDAGEWGECVKMDQKYGFCAKSF